MIHCGKPAAFVVRDVDGMEWFVCAEHGAPDGPSKYPSWIVRTPIEDWFRARAMPVPDDPRRVCNEAHPRPTAN